MAAPPLCPAIPTPCRGRRSVAVPASEAGPAGAFPPEHGWAIAEAGPGSPWPGTEEPFAYFSLPFSSRKRPGVIPLPWARSPHGAACGDLAPARTVEFPSPAPLLAQVLGGLVASRSARLRLPATAALLPFCPQDFPPQLWAGRSHSLQVPPRARAGPRPDAGTLVLCPRRRWLNGSRKQQRDAEGSVPPPLLVCAPRLGSHGD